METVKRDAFLYLDPKPPVDEFAQCGTCSLFDPAAERCGIHGPDEKVDADDSCGLYIHGTPGKQKHRLIVTPKESGLVGREVRCENCFYFNPDTSVCGLFKKLNALWPEAFDLDVVVTAKGCCNAQTPFPKAVSRGLGAALDRSWTQD